MRAKVRCPNNNNDGDEDDDISGGNNGCSFEGTMRELIENPIQECAVANNNNNNGDGNSHKNQMMIIKLVKENAIQMQQMAADITQVKSQIV